MDVDAADVCSKAWFTLIATHATQDEAVAYFLAKVA